MERQALRRNNEAVDIGTGERRTGGHGGTILTEETVNATLLPLEPSAAGIVGILSTKRLRVPAGKSAGILLVFGWLGLSRVKVLT